MKLFIAEKPSAAQAIAERLPNATRRRGYWEADDALVAYCAGHLYGLAAPEHYDPKYKIWNMAHLPIIPEQWEWLPNEKAADLIATLEKLLADRRITTIVNAGDGDREGQAIVDVPLMLHQNQKRTLRFWVSAQDPASIDNGLRGLAANEDYVTWGYAAMARACADWTHGINLTRAKTLYAQATGKEGVWPIGRVQTPTLNLVVIRDRLIENFVPIDFFSIVGTFQHGNGEFAALWNPSTDAGLDEENRLVDAAVAQSILDLVFGQPGEITSCETKPRKANQPKGFSLTGITSAASKYFGYGAKQVLEICQSLYETHKLTSYPRSDCDFLPQSQFGAGPSILAALTANLPHVSAWIEQADTAIQSPIWNDAKVTAHHAIIPTGFQGNMAALSEAELNVYQLIAQNYIAQFYPAHEYDETQIQVTVSGEMFAAKGRVITELGWKTLYGAGQEEEGENNNSQALPVMEMGDPTLCANVECQAKKTTPPKHFTEASLQVTMENIHRYVDDEKEKALLKDGDGIGTPATRATIIEELGKRGFLQAKGKYIISTDRGRELIDEIPGALKSPGITATFESGLTAIQNGERDMNDFLSQQAEFVTLQVNQIKGIMPEQPPTHDCPGCGQGQIRRIQRKDGSGHFWSCNRWNAKPNACNYVVDDVDGEPGQPRPPKDNGPTHECPKCKKGRISRKARKDGSGYFWSCNRWNAKPKCSFICSDADGEPQL